MVGVAQWAWSLHRSGFLDSFAPCEAGLRDPVRGGPSLDSFLKTPIRIALKVVGRFLPLGFF